MPRSSRRLASSPQSAAAFAALTAGDADAPALFAAAIAADPSDPNLVLGEAEALLAFTDRDPTERLRRLLDSNPGWADGHRLLASLRWELGDRDHYTDGLTRAIAADPGNADLWNTYLHVLAGAEDYAGAAAAARRASELFGEPVLALIEANNLGMVGDDSAVEALLAEVPPGAERDAVEVRHRIRLAQWDRALGIVDRMVASPDADLAAWALAEVVWRKIGDARSAWLASDERMIARIDLGYSTQALDRLAAKLVSLHKQQRPPIGQSVRGGTQTRGRLLDRRDPELRQLRAALQDAVTRYRKGLPAADPSHPLLKHRDRFLKVDGGWSVRLTDAGFHVPHLHPAGVLSSAFHVRVPPLDAAAKEGWLELGRPPADLRMDLDSLAALEPQAGTLILFPSFLYHGTRPFPGGERLTVAFDVT